MMRPTSSHGQRRRQRHEHEVQAQAQARDQDHRPAAEAVRQRALDRRGHELDRREQEAERRRPSSAACAVSPPANCSIRCGSTGMISPNDSTSIRMVTKMKASAARRRAPLAGIGVGHEGPHGRVGNRRSLSRDNSGPRARRPARSRHSISSINVIPANAGIQARDISVPSPSSARRRGSSDVGCHARERINWIPAFTGMTWTVRMRGERRSPERRARCPSDSSAHRREQWFHALPKPLGFRR